MPNIYLRLPTSRCQFFRHRDPKHIMAKNEPLVFNRYMPEFFILKNGITNVASMTEKTDTRCFSEQQWKNMMGGASPIGGKAVVKRNKAEYLTFAEVQQLSGKLDYDKSANEDYLCIALPREVEVVDTVRVVTPTWNLSQSAVRRLVVMLNDDFKRSLVEWALSTFDFCTSRGQVICRSQTAMLERYLMRYGIEPTREEKDNLRRIIERWFKQEHCNFRAYSVFDMQYEDDSEKVKRIDKFLWE